MNSNVAKYQSLLHQKGFDPGPIDGDFGPKTWMASQVALNGHADAPKSATPADDHLPPWMQEMVGKYGLQEVRDNEELSAWLKGGSWLGDPSELPWCGDGVETSFARRLPAEKLPDRPFFAQSWKDFGIPCDPIVGAVGVIRWNARSGHVGFVADTDGSRVKLLGGNQSNSVSLAWFKKSSFIAFRWPSTFPIRQYPPLTQAAAEASMAATR